ncbi:MAG: endonuclease/exonuclease/phosphatase family protein, partial [Myxococcota bacterium]
MRPACGSTTAGPSASTPISPTTTDGPTALPVNRTVRILSWNVNGLRACQRRGFGRWLARSDADVVGVQEVRARLDDLPPALAKPRHWHARFSAAERAGYS